MTIEIIALAIVLAAVGAIAGYTLRYGDPPTPTSPKVRRALFDQLPNLTAGTVYDLGSGWGNLALALATHYEDRPVVGIEASPIPWLFARGWAKLSGKANIRFELGDFQTRPFGDAALLICYANGKTLTRLRHKIEQELPAGTVVITHTFEVRGWSAKIRVSADDLYRTPIYIYEVPDRRQTETDFDASD